MRDLQQIIADNNAAVERFKLKQKAGEDNYNRNCSFQGDSSSGVILHSAKCRETRFIRGGKDAAAFCSRWVACKSQAARNRLVESFFN